MVLTDFETSGVGPAAYDLSAVRVLSKRFGLPQEFADQLTAATGLVIDDQDQAMLDRLYELVGIAAVMAPHVRKFPLSSSCHNDLGLRGSSDSVAGLGACWSSMETST